MTLVLYAHPFSSYCQKVLIALYENQTAFEVRLLDSTAAAEELAAIWPLRRFPVLMDRGSPLVEASIIIEHLSVHHAAGFKPIPVDAAAALHTRMLDRFFDNYIHAPMQKIVGDAIRSPKDRDPFGVAEARDLIDRSYGWLDGVLADREWVTGGLFNLADCAAAPALFYADWVQPIGQKFSNVAAYRARLLARPSFARVVDEARSFRALFPLGAPDRD